MPESLNNERSKSLSGEHKGQSWIHRVPGTRVELGAKALSDGYPDVPDARLDQHWQNRQGIWPED